MLFRGHDEFHVCVVPSRPCALMRMPVAGLQGARSSATSSQVRRWFSQQLSRIGSACVPGLPGCQCGSEYCVFGQGPPAHSDESRCAFAVEPTQVQGKGCFYLCTRHRAQFGASASRVRTYSHVEDTSKPGVLLEADPFP